MPWWAINTARVTVSVVTASAAATLFPRVAVAAVLVATTSEIVTAIVLAVAYRQDVTYHRRNDREG